MIPIIEMSGVWHTRPHDQGQIIVLSYAMDVTGECLLRRVVDTSLPHDHPERTTRWYTPVDTLATNNRFEPWNGILPEVGGWTACAVEVGL